MFLVTESTGKCSCGPALETRNHFPSSERVSSLDQRHHHSMPSHCRENSLTQCTWKQSHLFDLSAKAFSKAFAQHPLSPGYIIWDGLMLDTQASKAEKT